MKFVCDLCGSQLPVDRDIDDDRTFDSVRERHLTQACPRKFTSDEPHEPNARARFAEQGSA